VPRLRRCGEESGGGREGRLAQSALDRLGVTPDAEFTEKSGNADPSAARRLRGAGAPVGIDIAS